MKGRLPTAYDGCTCVCHRRPGVKHFMACCGQGTTAQRPEALAAPDDITRAGAESPIVDGVDREATIEMVGLAMQEVWDEICDDTGCHPIDITREGRKTFFRRNHWARLTGEQIVDWLTVTLPKSALLPARPEPVVEQAALRQNDAMRQELANVGNLVSDLARAMRVDQANPDGTWPDLAGRISKLIGTVHSEPVVDGAAEVLSWFSGQHRLSLDHYSPVYGDDDDQRVEWRVTRESGSINDREFDVIGRGETALEAMIAARATLCPDHVGGVETGEPPANCSTDSAALKDALEAARQRAIALFQSYATGVTMKHDRGEDQLIHDVEAFSAEISDALKALLPTEAR